jgi:hypothetical protein
MDDELNRIIAEAIAEADEARRLCERPTPQLKQRDAGGELIFKTTENALIEPPPKAFTEAQMDVLFALADETGAITGGLENRIIQLENEVGTLRADNELLRSLVKSGGGYAG